MPDAPNPPNVTQANPEEVIEFLTATGERARQLAANSLTADRMPQQVCLKRLAEQAESFAAGLRRGVGR